MPCVTPPLLAPSARPSSRSPLAIIFTFGLMVACKDDAPAADGGSFGVGSSGEAGVGTADDSGGLAAPTYWQDVAPIYFESCVGCHNGEGIGPMRLDDYATAREWAAASAATVAARVMPPFLVTADGSCGDYHAPRVLSDAQVEVISAWAEAGAPEGEPRDDLTVPAAEELSVPLALTTPAFLPIAEGTAVAESDEYRCFRVDPALDHDVFATGYDVDPGNAAFVHHVLAFTVDPATQTMAGITNGERMDQLDAESPDREGWPCFGAAGEGVDPSGVPVSWAPGSGVTRFPAGSGIRIAAGEAIVLQIHYNLAVMGGDEPPPISTTLRLELGDNVEREGFVQLIDPFIDTLFAGEPSSLPPGEAAAEYTWELPLADFVGPGGPALDLLGVFPHMHERGISQRFEVVHADESSSCAADVPRWDFNWQLHYFYAEPMRLLSTDTLRVTCTYDTRDADGPVLPGWGTQNEMCLLGVVASLAGT